MFLLNCHFFLFGSLFYTSKKEEYRNKDRSLPILFIWSFYLRSIQIHIIHSSWYNHTPGIKGEALRSLTRTLSIFLKGVGNHTPIYPQFFRCFGWLPQRSELLTVCAGKNYNFTGPSFLLKLGDDQGANHAGHAPPASQIWASLQPDLMYYVKMEFIHVNVMATCVWA